MRHVLTAATAIAVCGFFAVTAARAETTHDLGGPTQSGKMCWAGTDGANGVYGYWTDCPKPAKMAKSTKKMKS